MNSEQIRIVRVACTAVAAELCADAMVALGAFAIEETSIEGHVELRAVMSTSLNDLQQAVARFDSDVRVDEEFLDSAVLTLWKSFVTPVEISRQLVIVPAWLEHDLHVDKQSVLIDTRDAFGIGDHPTTRLCATWIDKRDHSGKSLLDVGCGTGILAIIGKLRNASLVDAVDISATALETTRENAARNGVRLDFIGDANDLPVHVSYDIVIANILAPVLIEMADWLTTKVRPGGTLLLAGLRADQSDRVLAAFGSMELASSEETDGWALLELKPH